MRKIVIAGAGLAGHRAAVALRGAGFDGDLTIVGDEVHRPYDRPPLSKQLLAGSFEDEACFFDCDGLDGVEWKLGTKAAGLDPAGGILTLEGGEEIPFDGLVIATGRRARELPNMPALEGIHTLRTIDDSKGFKAAVANGAAVVIIGAGFIGCEVAATLRGLGVEEVSVVDVAPHPMPVLGPEVGERATKLHTGRGVKLHLGSGVAAIDGDGRVETVRLESGESIPADVVLSAVGSAPNTEWLAGSGLELHKGTVLCDQHCFAAGTENVVAAGDVAAWPHPGAGGEVVSIEHWSNARDMGATAAENLIADPAGRKAYATVPTFWSDQYDVKIKSAGLLAGLDGFEVVDEDPAKPSLVAEARDGSRLAGAIVFNKNRRIIDYQRELAEQLGKGVASHA